jgi:N-acetylglucosamine-6-sulfatase
MAELYDLQHDPEERFNLIADPSRARLVAELKDELARLMLKSGLTPASDKMPIDAGISTELPDQKIR